MVLICKMIFIRPVLGTNPANEKILDEFIIEKQRTEIEQFKKKIPTDGENSKYANAQEISEEIADFQVNNLAQKSIIEELADEQKRGTTVFFFDQETNRPAISSHMIKGFLKGAAKSESKTRPKERGKFLSSLTMTCSVINEHIVIESLDGKDLISFDRDIERHENGKPKYLERSLRAETAMGPRISLQRSEIIMPPCSIEFRISVKNGSPATKENLDVLFQNGDFCGFGQWRNAGYGRFHFTLENATDGN